MDAVIDSSSLISLARAGLLPLLRQPFVQPIILDAVRIETVDAGLAGSHPDAVAIEAATVGWEERKTPPGQSSVDAVVLEASRPVGMLVANDQALGRRARSLGVRWLRTADLVVLLVRTEHIPGEDGRRAVMALRDAGRLTAEMADEYCVELEQ
jgi:predicted nucleic acid-binding protein